MKIQLVRHPKKTDEGKKPESNENPTKDTPPVEPPVIDDESRIRRGLNMVFWLRVGLGILAGAISAILGSPMDVGQRIPLGFGIMIVMFIVSYAIAKGFKVPLLPSDKKKLATTGYGSYFLMFIFSWILINTIINSSTSPIAIH